MLVNPNTASPDLLAALLLRLGTDAGQASRIAATVGDWRTPGRCPMRRGLVVVQCQKAGLR